MPIEKPTENISIPTPVPGTGQILADLFVAFFVGVKDKIKALVQRKREQDRDAVKAIVDEAMTADKNVTWTDKDPDPAVVVPGPMPDPPPIVALPGPVPAPPVVVPSSFSASALALAVVAPSSVPVPVPAPPAIVVGPGPVPVLVLPPTLPGPDPDPTPPVIMPPSPVGA